MEKIKIGFFNRIFLSISDFRIYPIINKERTFKAIGYFIKLLLLASFFLSLYIMTLLSEFVRDGVTEFERQLPYFEISDGKFYCSGEANFDVNSYLTIVIKNENMEDISFSKYTSDRMYFVMANDGIKIGNSTSDDISGKMSYDGLPDTTKDDLIKEIHDINNSFANKLIVFGTIYSATLFYIFFNRLLTLVMYILVIMIFNGLFLNKLKFRNFFKISIYISTLPILLELFAILIGGNYSQTADFITFLIASVYAFYALRAIRLDEVLNNSTGVTPEEKIVNAIKNAQEELEKQIEELEDKAKREDESKKEDESKNEENNNKDNTEDDGNK